LVNFPYKLYKDTLLSADFSYNDKIVAVGYREFGVVFDKLISKGCTVLDL